MKRAAKILTVMAVFSFMVFLAHGGNIITGGTKVRVLSGSSLVSVTDLTIRNGGTLDNSGTVILIKNLTNENGSANSLGSGLLVMAGTMAQIISGTNIIQDLALNNAEGMTNFGETRVNGVLTLTSGNITLGSFNLTLGPSATVEGTPTASAMIIVTGTGQLRKEFPNGFTGTFLFPVGDATGTPEYSPVILVFSTGNFAMGNYAGVNLVNNKYPNDTITGNYLNRYWTITQSGISGFICNAGFQYLPADVTGTESLLSCTRVNPSPWVTYALTNTATHILSATGLTTFSTFTGLKSATPPKNQELVNIDIHDGTTACYDALEHLTVAGSGTTFVVENNGNVTLIAGNKISLLPGVKVYPGGYMHATISTTFCGSTFNPLVSNPANEDNDLLFIPESKEGLIRIYPNPTSDLVTLELSLQTVNPDAFVTIYNMNGKLILKQELKGENRHQFSLANQPVGIYLIQVRTEERMEISKIVKR